MNLLHGSTESQLLMWVVDDYESGFSKRKLVRGYRDHLEDAEGNADLGKDCPYPISDPYR